MSLPKPSISLTNQTRTALRLSWLKRLLRQTLPLQNITTGSWSITFVNDPAMAQLHQRTMNLPTTTDVLTFDMRDDNFPPIENRKSKIENLIDLDTVICVDEARRRAADLNHPLDHELLLYAIHSLLHVTGYDDQTPAQAKRMHRREDEILIRLGIGPVYAPTSTRRSASAPSPRRPKIKKTPTKTGK